MNTALTPLSRSTWTLLALAAALASTSALAANKSDSSDAQARYQKERAVCLSGQSNQARDTCLREAGAALAETKKGGLDDGGAYKSNAVKRCQQLPDADRSDCIARIDGQGTTSGSVAAGGIYRELVTTVPASPAKAASNAKPAAYK